MEGYIQSGYGNIITPFGEGNGEGSAKPRESQAVGARGPDWFRAWAVSCNSRAYFTPGMRRSPYRILPQGRALLTECTSMVHNIPELPESFIFRVVR